MIQHDIQHLLCVKAKYTQFEGNAVRGTERTGVVLETNCTCKEETAQQKGLGSYCISLGSGSAFSFSESWKR